MSFLSLQHLETWVNNPDNQTHPKFKIIVAEYQLCSILYKRLHNHNKDIDDKLAEVPFTLKVALLKMEGVFKTEEDVEGVFKEYLKGFLIKQGDWVEEDGRLCCPHDIELLSSIKLGLQHCEKLL